MIDFNNEENQKERNAGPVPDGSRVLVKLELQTPRYASPANYMLALTKSGLLQLFCKLTVQTGEYKGTFWYENVTLPAGCQTVALSDNQQLSAKIGGSLLRAIIEAARRIDPEDTSQAVRAKRNISDWQELNGLVIPVKVGIDKKPFTSQDGREFWNNRILSVVPVTNPEFQKILNGQDFITKGPVTGKGGQSKQRGQNGYKMVVDYVDEYDSANPEQDIDTVPF